MDLKSARAHAEKLKLIEINEGDWWTQTDYNFFAYAKGDKITIPKEIMDELKIEDEQLLIIRIRLG